MITIYVYVLDTLADWEIGYVTAELNSGRFFKKDAARVALKTVSHSKEAITTMGGMKIMPDCTVDEIAAGGISAVDGAAGEGSVLLLPGANTWADAKHGAVIETARAFLAAGGTVCAICGATVALAGSGLFDARPHTSNGPGFLDLFAPAYKGQRFYIDKESVADGNLITAGSTGCLAWAREIIGHLGVFKAETLEAWYAYFSTGKAEHFFALMQTVQQ